MSSEIALKVVDDLLTCDKIQNHYLQLSKETVNLKKLLVEAVEHVHIQVNIVL